MGKGNGRPRGYWNKERVLEAVKECRTRWEFSTKYPGAANWAKKHGCYDEVVSGLELKWEEKWTSKEACTEEVMKYTSFKEFRNNSRQCYQTINTNGWADELFAHFPDKGNYKKNRKKPGYWTKERCIEEARKYSTPQELMKASKGCHRTIQDHGWQEECFAHMTYRKQRCHCFSKDYLREIAAKYDTYPELRKGDKVAWDAMVRNGWVEELCAHMPPEEVVPLTFETCAKAAKKYTCRSDFQNNLEDRRYYKYAQRHGFLDDICTHMQTRHTRKTRCIYTAEFADHCAYIGLTFNHEYRWTDHLREDNSAVYKHIQETGLQPEFKIVHDYIKALEAQKLEGEYVEKYRAEGWTILNVAKAGSLGTSECYKKKDVLEHARRFASLDEFRIKDGGYYQSGYRSDYWDEVCAIFGKKAYHHYSEEEIMEAALQCKSRGEFQKRFKAQYQAAQSAGTLDKFCGHMEWKGGHRWSDKELWEAALQCKTRYEFQKRFTKQYNSVRHSKRLDIFCAHMSTENPKVNSFTKKGSK